MLVLCVASELAGAGKTHSCGKSSVIALPGTYYPRNTVIPCVIPKKTRLCQQHATCFWLVQIQNIPYPSERANPVLHLVQRPSLGSLWEGSEVRVKVSPSMQKSVTLLFFVVQRLFLFFFLFTDSFVSSCLFS